LTAIRDLDSRGWLKGVTTFNFHPHLPHYALTNEDTRCVQVLARQPIDMSRPHPFTEAGNREFNTFIWMPPNGARAGDILLADSTIFTTLFGGVESLETFLEKSSNDATQQRDSGPTGRSSRWRRMTFPSAGRLWRRRWTVVVANSISMTHITGWLIISGALLVIFSLLVPSAPLQAQIRGVYPLGMSATNSGSRPTQGSPTQIRSYRTSATN